MKEIVPHYQSQFCCIADRCRHSCCIGWEIDVDEDTLERYRLVTGDFGDRLRKNIAILEEGACFCMDEDERCPFLNQKGLCDIYTELGEDALCQICSDHPRYRNYFSDRVEMGLGLCCEAAAELILSQTEPLSLKIAWDDGEDAAAEPFEEWLRTYRDQLLAGVWNGSSCREIANGMYDDFTASGREWIAELRELEQLNLSWDQLLCELQRAPADVWLDEMAEHDNAFRNLLAYFLYRHVSASVCSNEVSARVGFACLSYRIICALCAEKKRTAGECTFEDLAEYARMYSLEIEYSEENTLALLMQLEKLKES